MTHQKFSSKIDKMTKTVVKLGKNKEKKTAEVNVIIEFVQMATIQLILLSNPIRCPNSYNRIEWNNENMNIREFF